MLDQHNITRADDARGVHENHTKFKLRHAIAGAAALGVFGWMVANGDACARPLFYLFGWMVAIPAGVYALGPLLARIPDDGDDDEEAD